MISKKHFYWKPWCRFCDTPELIENYNEAIKDDEMWVCHHRLETHFTDGTLRPTNAFISEDELRAMDMYFHRPPSELIFMKLSDHSRLHLLNKNTRDKVTNKLKGRTMPNDVRTKISISMKNLRARETNGKRA